MAWSLVNCSVGTSVRLGVAQLRFFAFGGLIRARVKAWHSLFNTSQSSIWLKTEQIKLPVEI
jgi:hypothetical protein